MPYSYSLLTACPVGTVLAWSICKYMAINKSDRIFTGCLDGQVLFKVLSVYFIHPQKTEEKN